MEAEVPDPWPGRAQRPAAHPEIAAEPDDARDRSRNLRVQPRPPVPGLRQAVGFSEIAGDLGQFAYRVENSYPKRDGRRL